jgi:2-dehydro-3-deoxyphosphogalactonate aldolase
MRTGFRPTGLIAILRGLTPAEAVAIGRAVADAGIGVLEVPLNSPDPCRSISLLREALPGCLVGAGTVLTTAQVEEAHAAGAQLVVSPNTDVSVISETVRRGLGSYPGAATPSEAFAAMAAGARAVKVFPAIQVGPAAMKAWTDVLPAWAELIPVGGIDASSFPAWTAAGATGFGIGSALYRAGRPPADVADRARALQSAWEQARTTLTGGARS